MKQERTKDCVRLLPWAVLTMNSQESSSTAYTPHQLLHGGRPAWFFKTALSEDYKSPVGDWLEHRGDLANLAGANLKHFRERESTRRNRTRRPATLNVGDLVLVHHSRLPTWPRDCLQEALLRALPHYREKILIHDPLEVQSPPRLESCVVHLSS